MNPQIPEDLQEMYHFAKAWRHEFGSERRYGAGTVEVLIERIATLTEQNERAQEALDNRQRQLVEYAKEVDRLREKIARLKIMLELK